MNCKALTKCLSLLSWKALYFHHSIHHLPSPPKSNSKTKYKFRNQPTHPPICARLSRGAPSNLCKQHKGLTRMIPACFSNPNTMSSSSQVPQNMITCIYQTHLCNSPTYLTLTWSKTLFSHSLTIYAADSFSITISLYPSTFSFFRSRPGTKSIYLTHRHYQRIKLYWDFTRAEFTSNSAEPESCFYVAISCNGKLEFFLGDLQDDLTRRSGLMIMTRQVTEPTLLSRREHVFGRRSYVARAQFLGSKHEIGIDCSGGVLKVKVDGEISLVVKRLAWKFRGNERIYVGGVEVEFFWDVFNWVNNSNGTGAANANASGHGVFIFQVGDGGVWPEMAGPEKRLMRKSLSSTASSASMPSILLSPSPSCSSVLQWAEESSDGGRTRIGINSSIQVFF